VREFVPIDGIPQQFYERPYFLGPDGNQADYFALAQALENQKREGIAHWVMRNKEYTGALGGQDGYLVLSTLRNEGEVIDVGKLPKPAGRAPTKKEIELAKHLVSMLEGEFNRGGLQRRVSRASIGVYCQESEGTRSSISCRKDKKKDNFARQCPGEEYRFAKERKTRCLNEPQKPRAPAAVNELKVAKIKPGINLVCVRFGPEPSRLVW
jgi:non-homologous end joining protein Ku